MIIKVDKRIELMTVIQTLDNYWDNVIKMFGNGDKTLPQCKYKENVNKYFEKYKNHETVKLYNSLSKDIGDITFFLNLALSYSNPPEFKRIADINNHIKLSPELYPDMYDSKFPEKKFIHGLKQFYKDTDFERFFANNKFEHKNILKDYIGINEIENNINAINNYLENDLKNYSIIVSALTMGNFGIGISAKNNIKYNYSVFSPCEYKNNTYIFGSKWWNKSILWHEIGHLTINDLTKTFIERFDTSNKIISECFVKHFYGSIESIVNEYIIRAITLRQFEIVDKEDNITGLIQHDVEQGFYEIEKVKNYIAKYCEKDNKLLKGEKYIELMDYVIKLI